MILDLRAESKGAVVFLPSIGWDIVNTQRTHHLARQFARQGYLSIFDSSNSYDDVSGFKEIEPNLFLFRGSEAVLSKIPDPILWALTYNFDRREAYGADARVVYDWIDDLDVFNFDRNFLERSHREGLRSADVVASVARKLHESAVQARPDAIYLPNAADFDHFANTGTAVVDDPDIDSSWRGEKPTAGYYGALAEWFDYDLLEEVAVKRGDWNFLLIGPMYDNSLRERGKSLLSLPNVRWIGPRSYQKLPAYLQMFDVAMVPFAINEITLATSPLKLFEYFAGGKPVLSTALPECEEFGEVKIANSAKAFAELLDVARTSGQEPAFKARLVELGRANSWAARVETVLACIGRVRQ